MQRRGHLLQPVHTDASPKIRLLLPASAIENAYTQRLAAGGVHGLYCRISRLPGSGDWSRAARCRAPAQAGAGHGSHSGFGLGGNVGYRNVVVRAAMLIAAFGLPAAPGAFPQATFGTITGAITDPSGAAVPNAAVTVTNQATGVSKNVVSDGRGNYEATHLNPGTYAITAEAAGFRKFEHRDLVLGSIQTARVDMRLEVGSTGSEVTVTAGTPVVETDAATISDSKTARELRDLPLNTLNGVILNAFLFSTPTGYQTAGSKFSTARSSTTTSTASAPIPPPSGCRILPPSRRWSRSPR
ncbi:MAG: hypothetical protein DMG07_11560 [Acidobacteria bacterium]|nr:MAG: hypothetical protein DMG07_11560 [Acidobacteriota bacterium]